MLKSASLTQSVYEQLRSDLLACRLKPGERLRIDVLCERMSAGSSAVREALARLVSEGFVCAEPQRGFRVAPISGAEMRDLTRVRIEIEGMCLRSSVACGDATWEAKLMAAYHVMSKTPERAPDDPARTSDAFAALHAEYHRTLVAACDSPWLLRLRELLSAQTERYRRLSIPLSKPRRDLNKEHREIMQAAIERQTDRAVRLMTDHLGTTLAALEKAELLEF